jgi:hypothetical protein
MVKYLCEEKYFQFTISIQEKEGSGWEFHWRSSKSLEYKAGNSQNESFKILTPNFLLHGPYYIYLMGEKDVGEHSIFPIRELFYLEI